VLGRSAPADVECVLNALVSEMKRGGDSTRSQWFLGEVKRRGLLSYSSMKGHREEMAYGGSRLGDR
jgi:hypothetical protein